MITATIHTERMATVHERPSWLARLALGRVDRDYEVQRVLVGANRYEWLGPDNRPLSPQAAEAIGRAEARAEARAAVCRRILDLIRK